MSSSWIKIEVITPDKPEVYKLAELLDRGHQRLSGGINWINSQE